MEFEFVNSLGRMFFKMFYYLYYNNIVKIINFWPIFQQCILNQG